MIRRMSLTILILAALGAVQAADAVTIQSKYPGLSSGALRQAVPGVVTGALLEADGIKITAQDLVNQRAQFTSPAREQFAMYEFALLENLAIGKLIDKESRDWASKNSASGLQGEQLMRQYVSSLIGEVTVSDDEALQFYKDFTQMLGGATYEKSKEAIKSYLRDQRIQTLLNNHVATLSARHSVRISDAWAKQQYQKWIKTPVEQARRSGKPTMAKFGSVMCKPCLTMAPIIKELAKKYGGKLAVLDIDVDKEPVLAMYYGAQAIPLLIFYDKNGKEVLQHVGGWDKASIEAGIAQTGVK